MTPFRHLKSSTLSEWLLAQVLGNAAAPRYRLQRIITTREEDHKSGSPPNSLQDLEQYADGTVGQVQALQVSHYICVPYTQAGLNGPPQGPVQLCTSLATISEMTAY